MVVVALTASLFLCCSGDGEAPPYAAVVPATIEPTPASPSATLPSPTLAPTPTPTLVSGAAYDSSANMYRLLPALSHHPNDTLHAIELAAANGDKSMVPVLIEMLRFFDDYVHAIEARKALTAITGRQVRGNEGSWSSWMEWLVQNLNEYQPPVDYLDWKIALMNRIDPRFGGFLAPAEGGSVINPVEIVWGGVPPDGIPDLQSSPVVSAQQQDYLQPDDRIFGVSINGEHRAYPLRIVNAHEMANDVLGGEPISLAY